MQIYNSAFKRFENGLTHDVSITKTHKEIRVMVPKEIKVNLVVCMGDVMPGQCGV